MFEYSNLARRENEGQLPEPHITVRVYYDHMYDGHDGLAPAASHAFGGCECVPTVETVDLRIRLGLLGPICTRTVQQARFQALPCPHPWRGAKGMRRGREGETTRRTTEAGAGTRCGSSAEKWCRGGTRKKLEGKTDNPGVSGRRGAGLEGEGAGAGEGGEEIGG